MSGRKNSAGASNAEFGAPVDKVFARRERIAQRLKGDFGVERVFPELLEALIEEIPAGGSLAEVAAGTGLLTPRFLERADSVTAIESADAMLERLLAKEFARDSRLTVFRGLVNDLDDSAFFDNAVITFTPRRGVGLLALLTRLGAHVRDRVVILLDDASMDWAYLARSAALRGFDVRLRLVTGAGQEGEGQRSAVLMTAFVSGWCAEDEIVDIWEEEARVVRVPYPAPRGASPRLIRYFLAGGDRAMLVRTTKAGARRLYGNLRTAAHRLGRDEITVRWTDDGVQLMKLPKVKE